MDHATKIGLPVAIVIGINAMVGAGIVAIPAMLSSQAGPAGVLSFVLSVAVVLCMSFAFGRLAFKHQGDAWAYTYPKLLGGHRLGVFASVSYLAGLLIAMSFLVQQAGLWGQHFIPNVDPAWLGGGLLAVLTLLIMAGARASSWGQYVIAFIVVVALTATAIVCLQGFDANRFVPFVPFGTTAVLLTAPKALFSLMGFESITSLASIIRNPERNVSRAGIYSVLVVGALYLLFIVAIIGAVPADLFSGEARTLTEQLSSVFPEYSFVSYLLWLGGFFAIIGTLHSMVWSLNVLLIDTLQRARHPVAAALAAKVSKHENYGVAATAAIIMLLSLTLRSELVLNLTVALIGVSYVLAHSALLKDKDERGKFSVVWILLAVAGGLAFCGFSLAKILS